MGNIIVNKLILRHLATAYVLYGKTTGTPYLSFEEYCNRYNATLKNDGKFISEIILTANNQMKKEKNH